MGSSVVQNICNDSLEKISCHVDLFCLFVVPCATEEGPFGAEMFC